MRDIGEAHSQVVDDVVPLPAHPRGDRRRAAHQRVEDAVQTRNGETLVAGPLAAMAAVVRHVRDVRRRDRDVVVERNDDVLLEQTLHASLFGVGNRDAPREYATDLPRELERLVVGVGLEILEGAVAVVARPLHRRCLMGVRILRSG